jgi:hypothetical protein
MANKSNLLKEAIADAKAVRETAIANAKLALEEAFTPKLQSMLSKKIEEEMEDEDEDTVEEQSVSSNIGSGGVKVADGNDEEKAETKTSSASAGTEGDDTVVDKLTENEDEEEIEETYEGEEEEVTEDEDEDEVTEESELDAELEEIIKELEAEDEETAEEGTYEGEEMEDEPVAMEDEMEDPVAMEDEEMEEPVAAEDEEMDLEEIIKSLREEDEDEEEITETEDDNVDDLKDELEEAYSAIRSLKGTINEVNLLNAKLLFSNKLFRSHNLTEGQKMRVIETFDRAANVREVKLVFSTLAESLSSGATRKSSLKEGYASKATKSTRPAKAVIVEANQFNNRMKKLAGLL